MNTKQSHAVVIGGSMTGMLAARVLSDHFDKVTLIERDRYPESPDVRNGVPQARHVHILLVRGMRILEHLFPGIDAELDAAGAAAAQWGKDTVGRFPTGWQPEYVSEHMTRVCSRALLDWTVYQHIAANSKITLMEETQVNGLLTTDDKSQVTGIRIQSRKGSREEQPLHADFVVDASGRASNTPDWLTALGYQAPEVSIVNSFLGYGTRWYKLTEEFKNTTKLMLIQSIPPHMSRGGIIMQVEGDRMVVTLAGAAKDYPPTEEAAYMEFMRSLASTKIYDLIKNAEPLTPIYGYQRTANQWQHYERLQKWPENFIVMGDAACGFNPVYGQGMSAAAVGAMTLDEMLRANSTRKGLAQGFQKRLAKAVAPIWVMATGEDFRYPGTEGERSGLTTRFMHWYNDQLMILMSEHTDVLLAFTEVANLIKPPTYLLQPRIFFKVLRLAIFGGKKPQADQRSTQQAQAIT